MAKLGDVFSLQITGEWGSECDTNQAGTKILRTTNFTSNGTIDYSNIAVRKIAESKIEKKRLKKGDIILEKSGGTEKTPVGRVVFCDKAIENDIYLCNNFTQAMRVNPAVAYPRYVFYFMWYLHYSGKTDLLQNKTTGIRNLRVKSYLDEKIPLPSLDEQRRIAVVLDKISDLIALRRAQLDKLDLLVKSRFVEMFGDPACSTRWPTKKLSQLGELNRGVSKHRPRNDPALLGGPYPLIQTGDVSNSGLYITEHSASYSELGLAQSRLWKVGTLCITIAANIAQTSILTFDSCFPDSVVGFVPGNETNAIFIHYWFSFFQKILEEQAPQVAQKNINLKILSDLNVIVPPFDLQSKFAQFVSYVNIVRKDITCSYEKLQELQYSLQQNYFLGENEKE